MHLIREQFRKIKMDKILLKERLDKTIRVVFFTHYSLLYGANRSLLDLIDGLRDYPVIPYVIVPEEGDMTQALKDKNIEFAVFPVARWIDKLDLDGNLIEQVGSFFEYQKSALKRVNKNLKLLTPIIQKLQSWDVNIIYTNSSVLPIGALISYKMKLPHVWHLREFVDLDYNLRFDWGNIVTKKTINQANAKIAISKSIYSHFAGLNSKNYHIIYNGIARQSEFDRLRQRLEDIKTFQSLKPYTFSLIGKISPGKGQEIAVRALSILQKSVNNVRLLIVGGGDDKSLKRLVGQLNLGHSVEFWGQITDPFDAYLESDAVLMCSKSEGMGRVTVEAMAACLPVIGYDNAGTSEIISHGHTGLLYQGGAEELANTMKCLVTNQQLGRDLGLAAWQNSRNEYCVELYAAKIFEVLLSVLSRDERSQLSNRISFTNSIDAVVS